MTRARAQAGAFAALLEAAGARVILVPTIAIEPPDSWEPLDAALGALDEYRWAVFTSVNGVAMVAPPSRGQPGAARALLARRRLAAIGPATADALRELGPARRGGARGVRRRGPRSSGCGR